MPENLVQITNGIKSEGEETPDLGQAYWRRTIAARIKEQFDAYALERAGDGYRDHLGASVIGNECNRYLYYHFRWFKKEIHSARMHSLFDQGHKIEEHVRQMLIARGAEFYWIDPNDHSKQVRFSTLEGHFGGSVDGIWRWPEIGLKDWLLLECKSQKTGAAFTKLSEIEVAGANPRHFAQQCTYGANFKIRNCAYIVYNKNDSSIYIEIVDLDWMLGQEMQKKAEYVIGAKTPPNRISKNPTYFLCKMCTMWGICHSDDRPTPNCRNCINASPDVNETWYCNRWKSTIPKEAIPVGCADHKFLPF